MLSVRVLGEPALELDDVPTDPPTGRGARALLGLLVLDRRLHSRSELAARLWPDVLDESARTSLRSALAALRRSLGPDADRYLVTTRERVGLHADVWTDTASFEQLAAQGRLGDALALCRGELLQGLDDDWVLAARDDWRERAAAVLAGLATEAEEAGDWAAAIGHTRRLVALHPLGEEGQRALIGRLARSGDRPAALAAYARYADRLRTELRIAPSSVTRALVDELRAARPAPTSGTVTLLFTDLVGSTELLAKLGEDGAERLRRDHFGLLRDVALGHAGQEVKSLGDGLMVAFGSSVDAAGCAIGIQQAVAGYNRRTGSDLMRVRVGLNVGEPSRDEDDYFGTPVVIAKRLCDRAEGGQILASELVRMLIGGRGGFTFRPVGDLELKGLAQPVASCEIAWAPASHAGIGLPAELARDPSTLVGRADELRAVQDAWDQARSGRLRVAMVLGEPGIGKTRIVAELCRRAHADGATVLLGRSHEDTMAPYQPFVEALSQYVAACPIDELRLQMGPRRGVLAKLVPELGAGVNEPSGSDASAERYALLDAVGSLLREVARTRPAILVLDDLHWADDASLLLLRHVARAAADAPLLILGTYRATEVHENDALSAALAELRRARVLDSIALGGLAADDVAALIRGLGAELPQEVAHAVARRTEGNPFFVEEIVRHVDAGGQLSVPESITDLLRRRLRQLGDRTQRVLSAAAVLGREFDLAVLERVSGSDGEALLEAIDAALAEHVLVAVPGVVGRFAFSHALIRETIYEQLSAARRPGLHLRAAQALAQLHAARLDDHAELLAHHFVQAGDDASSLDFQIRAARAAWRVYATDAAILQQTAALQAAARLGLSPEADARVRRLLLERGVLHQVNGDDEAGVADYGRAVAAARKAGDPRLEAQALDSLALAEKWFDVVRSREHQQQALGLAEGLGDVALQIRILSHASLTRSTDLDLMGALQDGERALELAEQTGAEDDRTIAIDALKLAALQLGDLEALAALTADLEASQRDRGDLWYLQWTLVESSFVPIAHARWDRAAQRLREALAIHDRVGDKRFGPVVHDACCWLARSRGDLGAALAEGRLAVELTDREGFSPFGAWTRATLGWTLLELRASGGAVAVLERGLADARTLSDRFRTAGHLAWAHALAGEGRRADAAIGEAQEALARLRVRPGGAFVFGFGAATSLARAQLAAGRPERGEAVLLPPLAVARGAGWHEATASISSVLGQCSAARGDADTARTLLRAAVEIADEHGLPGVGWEARAALARLSEGDEGERLRAASAAAVQRLAASVGDGRLAEAFVRATEG